MNKNIILSIIAVCLVGIVSIMLLNRDHQAGPAEKLSNSIDEVTEEIVDEIDDHTTSTK